MIHDPYEHTAVLPLRIAGLVVAEVDSTLICSECGGSPFLEAVKVAGYGASGKPTTLEYRHGSDECDSHLGQAIWLAAMLRFATDRPCIRDGMVRAGILEVEEADTAPVYL